MRIGGGLDRWSRIGAGFWGAGRLRLVGWVFCALLLTAADALSAEPMLPRVYRGDVDVSGWWMSEKLDGVRGRWDGKQLRSKNGLLLHPPQEFVRGLPPFALEGELWGGRGSFEAAAGLVRRQEPHEGWLQLRFGVFDVPEAPGSFAQRIALARRWFEQHPSGYAFVIEQTEVADAAHLERELSRILALGGEGLMVRRSDALYETGRSASILKVKRFEDAEAQVIAHLPGAGRNEGRLGALLVCTEEGLEFRIGTGFTDAQRQSPPPLGSTVSYKHAGFFESGLPRFPVYLRIREDAGL